VFGQQAGLLKPSFEVAELQISRHVNVPGTERPMIPLHTGWGSYRVGEAELKSRPEGAVFAQRPVIYSLYEAFR